MTEKNATPTPSAETTRSQDHAAPMPLGGREENITGAPRSVVPGEVDRSPLDDTDPDMPDVRLGQNKDSETPAKADPAAARVDPRTELPDLVTNKPEE